MDIFLFLMILMGTLAVLALIVGVSNDAVNFIGSAVGSKVATFKFIIMVAGLGIILGAVFSNGMMEVARKGVFHPEMFTFEEVIMIYLAVMITDIILLDVFNTLGLPTSTTVSMVFELLGASVAMSVFKIIGGEEVPSFLTFMGDLPTLGDYINHDKATVMVTGIFAVVLLAFVAGVLIQWLVRFMLTFDYGNRLKYLGGVIGGVALTSIVFYMLLKGAKGTTLIGPEAKVWIDQNSMLLMGICFLFFTLLSQFLVSICKVNILKVIVLVGTFALAMAFAGNDLVNFIGVPLAAFGSYELYSETGNVHMYMGGLNDTVKTPVFILAAAGIVMMLALTFSKKAHNVLKTTIDLSRNEGADERFRPNTISKLMVRASVYAGKGLSHILPRRISEHIELRFDRPYVKDVKQRDVPAFDLVRASVNVVVPAIIIAMGTNSTLPLSTTYTTFMVAMGSSLADRAWGLESAVYRVSGVVRVILGWFATALIAFLAAASLALLLKVIGIKAIIPIIIIAGMTVVAVKFFRKVARRTVPDSALDMHLEYTDARSAERVFDMKLADVMIDSMRLTDQVIKGLYMHSRSVLANAQKASAKLDTCVKKLRFSTFYMIRSSEDINGPKAAYYVKSLSYLVALQESVMVISEDAFEHLDNNHKPLIQYRKDALVTIGKRLDTLFGEMTDAIRENDYSQIIALREMIVSLSDDIDRMMAKEADRIGENKEFSRRNTNLYFGVLFAFKRVLWALSGFSSLFDRTHAHAENTII